MIELFEKFKDNLIFTGGTSLLKQGIISRFSEDIDLICKCSRKEIVKYLKDELKYDVEILSNGSNINTYKISVDNIEIKLDIVKYRKPKIKNIAIKSLNNKIVLKE